jgi:transcription elongation GreA/GreB family factor
MINAQTEANQHKGAMASRYDTFKEEAQALRDGYARQLEVLLRDITLLSEIKDVKTERVEFGSIVVTKEIDNDTGKIQTRKYFIFANNVDSSIKIGTNEYTLVSPGSPLGKCLVNMESGDIVKFRGKNIEITDVE